MSTTQQDSATATLRVDPDGRGIWLGDRHVPWAQVRSFDLGTYGVGVDFRSRQATIPFENGLVLSVTWGSGTCSPNHDALMGGPFTEEPDAVEMAVVSEDGLLTLPGGDTVMGYVPVADLAEALARVAALPSGTRALGPGFEAAQ